MKIEKIKNQLESTEKNDTFYITYYADKYKKIISRLGAWTKPNTDGETRGKHFVSKDNRDVFVYWDIHAEPNENGNKWRKAINPLSVVVEKAILDTMGEIKEND